LFSVLKIACNPSAIANERSGMKRTSMILRTYYLQHTPFLKTCQAPILLGNYNTMWKKSQGEVRNGKNNKGLWKTKIG